MVKYAFTSAIESISHISMITRAIVRSISVCAICIFIASTHVHCAFVDILRKKFDMTYSPYQLVFGNNFCKMQKLENMLPFLKMSTNVQGTWADAMIMQIAQTLMDLIIVLAIMDMKAMDLIALVIIYALISKKHK